jgi:cell division protein FtsQ
MWDDPKALNAFAATLASIAIALLAIGAVVWAARNDAFALREVVVATPLARSSPANLEAAIRSDLSGTFFTLDLDTARAALVRVPWVRNVSLRRQWPGRLEIAVEEHVPYARWGDSGLVNEQGEISPRPTTASCRSSMGRRARFRGDGAAPRVERCSRRSTSGSGAVAVSPRGGWRLGAGSEEATLAIERRDEPDARLARFVAAYGRTIGALARSGTRVGEVDLRYRNGFAARVPGFREKPPKRAL